MNDSSLFIIQFTTWMKLMLMTRHWRWCQWSLPDLFGDFVFSKWFKSKSILVMVVRNMVIKFTSNQIPQWCIPVWKIAIGDWTQFCQLQEFTLNIERCICSIIYCQLRFYTVGFLSSGANYLKLLLAAERWIMDPATVRLDYENKLLIWIIWIRWLPERVSRIILNMVWDII